MGYITGAKEINKFVYKHQKMVICFAAENHGEEPVRRALDEGHIGAEAAAKNCIIVGASRSSRNPMDPNPDALADFSSRGPVKNRRHKPDVVAPGTCVLSANSGIVQTPANPGPDNHWCYKEETSMATLLVAGYATVLRKTLTSRYHSFPPPFPSAALIKALHVNGADILEPTASNFVPSNKSEHGRINIANTIAVVHGEPGTDFHEDKLIGPTSEWLKKIDVKSGYTLTLYTVWRSLI